MCVQQNAETPNSKILKLKNAMIALLHVKNVKIILINAHIVTLENTFLLINVLLLVVIINLKTWKQDHANHATQFAKIAKTIQLNAHHVSKENI